MLCFFTLSLFTVTLRGQVSTNTTGLQLSRADAVRQALSHNPALAAAREQVAQARAGVVIAGAFADPSIALDVAGQTRALSLGSGNANDAGIGWTVPFPGKTGMRRAVATADLRASEFSLDQLRQQIASDAAQAYDAILVAMQHRDDIRQSRDLANDFLAKTEHRFKAGTVPKLDVLKAEVDVSQAGNDLIASERAVDTARATLNRIMGRSGAAPLTVTDTLDVPPPLPPGEELQKLAEASRPEIQGLAAQLQGAHTATRLAREYWAPDIDVGLERNGADGVPASYTTSVGFGVPLFFWQHQRGEVASARHRERELAADVADLRAEISLEVENAWTSASTALRQAIFIRDHLLPEAREVYRVASVSYGLGGSSALELLDAKRVLLDAESQYAEALGAANDARAALELAIGAPLPEANDGDQQ
ncbi:MAG: TolC family protein [Thermoanaerobaculia bacterium]